MYTFCVSVKVKRSVTLLCLCALPEKAILEKTYTVLGGTLNSTHSLTLSTNGASPCWVRVVGRRFEHFYRRRLNKIKTFNKLLAEVI